MTTQVLTQKEKELIAVGGSVSAGCVKCSNYHFKQAFEQGASMDEVHRAVVAATAVIYNSVEISQRNAFRLMDIERQEVMVGGDEAEGALTTLIKLAAAVAVNNVINVKRYIEIADKLGVSSSKVHLTIKLAQVIQNRAGEFIEEAIGEASPEANPAD